MDHETRAEKRGAIQFIAFLISGGMDDAARKALGLPEEPPKPMQDYMPSEVD